VSRVRGSTWRNCRTIVETGLEPSRTNRTVHERRRCSDIRHHRSDASEDVCPVRSRKRVQCRRSSQQVIGRPCIELRSRSSGRCPPTLGESSPCVRWVGQLLPVHGPRGRSHLAPSNARRASWSREANPILLLCLSNARRVWSHGAIGGVRTPSDAVEIDSRSKGSRVRAVDRTRSDGKIVFRRIAPSAGGGVAVDESPRDRSTAPTPASCDDQSAHATMHDIDERRTTTPKGGLTPVDVRRPGEPRDRSFRRMQLQVEEAHLRRTTRHRAVTHFADTQHASHTQTAERTRTRTASEWPFVDERRLKS
jgi:hypothetical protein